MTKVVQWLLIANIVAYFVQVTQPALANAFVFVPFLALTSLSKLAHATKASECGFDGFEEKLDHDRLIKTVSRALKSRQNRPRSSAQGTGQ